MLTLELPDVRAADFGPAAGRGLVDGPCDVRGLRDHSPDLARGLECVVETAEFVVVHVECLEPGGEPDEVESIRKRAHASERAEGCGERRSLRVRQPPR